MQGQPLPHFITHNELGKLSGYLKSQGYLQNLETRICNAAGTCTEEVADVAPASQSLLLQNLWNSNDDLNMSMFKTLGNIETLKDVRKPFIAKLRLI